MIEENETKKYVIFVGNACVDDYYFMEVWPLEGEKGNCKYLKSVAGGMIANAACVSAGFGVRTSLFGVVGKNKEQDFLINDLKSFSVDTSKIVREKNHKNGKCLIFQSFNDRTIICLEGDEYKFELNSEQIDFIKNASYIYLPLFFHHSFVHPEEFLLVAKEGGTKIVFDVEINSYIKEWREFLQHANTIFLNEHAVEKFAEGKSKSEDLLREMISLGVENVIVTMGENGCRLFTADTDLHIPGHNVPIVDTTGAGDTFNSTFMVCRMLGYSKIEALKYANAAGAMSIREQGPRAGITSIEEIQEFLSINAI